MTEATSNYVPGVCNINPAEIKQRRNAGHLGLAIFAVLLIVMVALSLNRYVRLLLIAPAILAAVGYLQAKNHFCVGYAGAGMQHADDEDSALKIIEEAAVAKDKKRARQINTQAVLIGIAAGLATLLIPVFN